MMMYVTVKARKSPLPFRVGNSCRNPAIPVKASGPGPEHEHEHAVALGVCTRDYAVTRKMSTEKKYILNDGESRPV